MTEGISSENSDLRSYQMASHFTIIYIIEKYGMKMHYDNTNPESRGDS